MKWLRAKIYNNMILPIIKARPTQLEFRNAMGIGIFVAFLPIVGIQMYVCLSLWVFFKKFKKEWSFSLPTSIALVWLTNPFTIGPIYYLYFVIGNWVLSLFSPQHAAQGLEFFQTRLQEIGNAPSFLQMLRESGTFLFVDTGLPLLLGSLIVTLPGAILGYLLADRIYLRIEKLFVHSPEEVR